MARLLLDAMLGSLARHLRMLGHDAAYALDRGVEADDALAALAREEDRRLVTRDRALARGVDGGLLVESKDVDDQLGELRDAGLDVSLGEPERCAGCNGALEPLPPGVATPGYAPDSDEETVWRCRECGQHFWKGSHWEDLGRRLEEL